MSLYPLILPRRTRQKKSNHYSNFNYFNYFNPGRSIPAEFHGKADNARVVFGR